MKTDCTDCGKDAHVGLSNFHNVVTGELIIGHHERLCLPCARKRNIHFFGKRGLKRGVDNRIRSGNPIGEIYFISRTPGSESGLMILGTKDFRVQEA